MHQLLLAACIVNAIFWTAVIWKQSHSEKW